MLFTLLEGGNGGGEGAEEIHQNIVWVGTFQLEGDAEAGFVFLGVEKSRKDLIEVYKMMKGINRVDSKKPFFAQQMC